MRTLHERDGPCVFERFTTPRQATSGEDGQREQRPVEKTHLEHESAARGMIRWKARCRILGFGAEFPLF
jgi:hypothetical protein